ncbi:hypothetical protein CAOG_009461 [Capsaspora owczarzaki ATCC 30864]|uniref:Uncharacterized protein n=1 Tax=Capsaspora owczarzaki (strain ATCC 30864) TaxID=595528 RepID=A0A0D2WJW9_CAPO3|nr:hypothetical protein CAOG_009461 [Capsaspora owczarzaki ATCC 30864]
MRIRRPQSIGSLAQRTDKIAKTHGTALEHGVQRRRAVCDHAAATLTRALEWSTMEALPCRRRRGVALGCGRAENGGKSRKSHERTANVDAVTSLTRSLSSRLSRLACVCVLRWLVCRSESSKPLKRTRKTGEKMNGKEENETS